jgi:hypothetical protein
LKSLFGDDDVIDREMAFYRLKELRGIGVAPRQRP